MAHLGDTPIGIFDSSFGGPAMARAVLDQLPHEPTHGVPVTEGTHPATRRAAAAARDNGAGVISIAATAQSMACHDACAAAPGPELIHVDALGANA